MNANPIIGREVVALLLKGAQGPNPEILTGLKQTGPSSGFLLPPGGKIKEEDKSPLHAVKRECFEESDLRVSRGVFVAKLLVTIANTKVEIHVSFFEFRGWRGRLVNMTPEYSWLKFLPVANYPWDKALPGDSAWLKGLLDTRLEETYWWKQPKQILSIHVRCGENRHDLLEVIHGTCDAK